MNALSQEAFLHQQSENKLNILFQRDYPYPTGNSWHKALIHLPLQTWAKLLLISLVRNQALIKSTTSFTQLLSLSTSLVHRLTCHPGEPEVKRAVMKQPKKEKHFKRQTSKISWKLEIYSVVQYISSSPTNFNPVLLFFLYERTHNKE